MESLESVSSAKFNPKNDSVKRIASRQASMPHSTEAVNDYQPSINYSKLQAN